MTAFELIEQNMFAFVSLMCEFLRFACKHDYAPKKAVTFLITWMGKFAN